ncbi:MBL fold metallo-hydrolase [Mycobacterium kubicae]|uniref:MBL fold metallo-hydrolase n=1 Tax=Mycobacterium kubicae TaxID=120959 RepID=A0AAX1J2V8_9MYCO|nr:MBL fold metallo-hydrolase [Mycobacterium kubicae]MCV7096080.1 MBL fold metallo-hydrolase [Mycobacterium kubicae]ORV99242.1 MBL fold metallo-hydrolase [Mycobacterium kubicae]QNI12237.1 MBL fold metallo-hydrolase [Mycobacterium kubicae]QPI35751.1 MBL fold metallo-hydrolase [Mycobacterium kubicae]GFG65224.1 MBL fold metallo-hydrolase [Mycobacterium kubicae]
MRVEIIETSSLGDRSYVVVDDDAVVVIDPQRDIDRVLELLGDNARRITHVLETHLHNDYVTGGLELSRVTGAEYVLPRGDDVGYPARRVQDGDTIDAGSFTLRVIHTPGHTREHVSYALRDASGRTVGVFTGGSMLYDTTGRTDLLGHDHTHDLSVDQYRSVRRLAAELPADAQVYPTHGFGSFCSADASGRDSSTVGEQRSSNPALTKDEETFVEELMNNLSAYPAYYEHMGVINRNGPEAVSLSAPVPVDPAELRRRIEAGEWVVDLRSRTAFAAGHLGGSYGFELSDSFVTYLGWLYAWGQPLTLIGDDADQIATARRELVRIGVDEVRGAASGDIEQLAGDAGLRSYRVADFAALVDEIRRPDVAVLDVRRDDEFRDSHVLKAINIPIHELAGRLDELPDAEIWVHCASGYRASVAASILDKHGRSTVLVDDKYAAAEELGLTETGSQ